MMHNFSDEIFLSLLFSQHNILYQIVATLLPITKDRDYEPPKANPSYHHNHHDRFMHLTHYWKLGFGGLVCRQ